MYDSFKIVLKHSWGDSQEDWEERVVQLGTLLLNESLAVGRIG